MTIRAIFTSLGLLCCLPPSIGFAGDIVFQHSGDTDPIAEGWTQVGPSGDVTANDIAAGAVTNDLGLDAWLVDDNSSKLRALLHYNQTPTNTQINQSLSYGWTLRTRLRVVDQADAISTGSILVEYSTGSRRYSMVFGSEADGDPLVQLWDGGFADPGAGNRVEELTGLTLALQGGGSGYHLYELIYSPETDLASLLIDGVQQLSGYSGHTFQTDIATNRVAWGSGSSLDTGEGRYNSVEFEIERIPTPSSALLFIAGLAILAKRKEIRSQRI